uniref:Pleckstrin homology domain containing, family A member 5 n=1 Tax=Electrophorus electricus TaxID=8005 RepID=A0A4W4DTJ2_ELEEL
IHTTLTLTLFIYLSVTCKHPVSGTPSQDNCIFVVNEQPTSKAPADEKKERPTSTMSEASNYTGGSDYTGQPCSPTARPSRSSKKVHNFGKRSNSIKRNPNAPVVKSNWLYKQDSTGMKMWKKRWFVLSDMCLFYYRDEKEEGILGSILLPSFHISMLSVDDHISKKYAFKAAHPNMRTYYFCTDTAKEMESWMKVMTDAALVHTEPIRRYTINKDGEKCTLQKDSEKYVLQKDSEQYLHREGSQTMPKERPKAALPRKAEKPGLQREGDRYGFQKEGTVEQPLTKINSIKLQPAQAAAIATRSPVDVTSTLSHRPSLQPQHMEPDKSLGRTNSVQRLEQWARIQHSRGILSRQTSTTKYLNMPSHRTPVVPRYPEGYRTLPRNMLRPGSVCSVAGSAYDRALPSAATAAEKRRSLRDDTMWQLYEWQQRQTQSRLGYGTLPSPKTMGRIAESIPASPSHGSLGMYHTISPNRPLQTSYNPATSQVSSPVFRGDVSLERRRRAHLPKYAYPPDRRVSVAQSVTPQSLQGKTVCYYFCLLLSWSFKVELNYKTLQSLNHNKAAMCN